MTILSNRLNISSEVAHQCISLFRRGDAASCFFQFARALMHFYCSFCHVINSYVNKINFPQLVLHVIPSHSIVHRTRLRCGRCSLQLFPLQQKPISSLAFNFEHACVCGIPTTTNLSGGQISSPRRVSICSALKLYNGFAVDVRNRGIAIEHCERIG